MWTRKPAALPDVEPILPQARAQPFDDPDYLFEPKYDGVRGLLYVTRKDCHWRSESGGDLRRFQELGYWVREELAVKEAILDGEILALDPEGRQDFRALMAGQGNLHYTAFDVLWVNGRDLRRWPLTRRKKELQGIIWATSTVLSQAFSIEHRGRDLYRTAERLDLEGIVSKRKTDIYRRETVWYIVRNQAYTQMAGRRELFRGRPR